MQQQPGQAARGAPPALANVVALVVQAFAVTVEVFIRRRIGSRYIDRQAALALIVIPGFGLLWPEHDLRPLVCFLGAFVVACGVVRATSLRRRFRGLEEHSRYNGWPVVLKWPVFRRVGEARAKSTVEPLLVFAVGGLATNLSVPLGAYWMVCAFALIAGDGILRAYEERRLLDLKDQLTDQRRMSERFRDRGW